MKNRIRKSLGAAAVLAALLPGAALATTKSSSEQAQLIAQLEQREQRVSSLIHQKTSGAQWSQLVHQRQQLHGLIDKLRSGQQVDPADVERLLGASPR